MDEPSSVTFLLCCVPSCDDLIEVCYDLLHDVIQKSFFCFSSAKLAEHVLGKYWSRAPDSENKRTTAFRIFYRYKMGYFVIFFHNSLPYGTNTPGIVGIVKIKKIINF